MADTEIPQARLEEILAGCEGVTPGPWREPYHDTCSQCKKEGRAEYGVSEIPGGYHAMFGNKADAYHIARLDPATISSIITELLDRRARSSLMDVAVEALDKMAQPLTFAGNVAYNMKQTTSTVESAREFERINGWVDEALSIRRAALAAIKEAGH